MDCKLKMLLNKKVLVLVSSGKGTARASFGCWNWVVEGGGSRWKAVVLLMKSKSDGGGVVRKDGGFN